MEMYVLVIDHNDGYSVFPCISLELADEALLAYVREYWPNEFPDMEMPEDIDEAVEHFFTYAPGEYYAITSEKLIKTQEDIHA